MRAQHLDVIRCMTHQNHRLIWNMPDRLGNRSALIRHSVYRVINPRQPEPPAVPFQRHMRIPQENKFGVAQCIGNLQLSGAGIVITENCVPLLAVQTAQQFSTSLRCLDRPALGKNIRSDKISGQKNVVGTRAVDLLDRLSAGMTQ